MDNTREAALAELEVERYTPIDNDHLNYEATIEDPKVFTRPWKISMQLHAMSKVSLNSGNTLRGVCERAAVCAVFQAGGKVTQ